MANAELNFRIGGNASGFQQALQAAQRAHQQASDQMSSAFQRATERAKQILDAFAQSLANATRIIGSSIAQSATVTGNAWQGAIEGAANSVTTVVHSTVNNMLLAFTGGGVVGAMAVAAYALFSSPIEAALERAKRAFAKWALDMRKAGNDAAADVGALGATGRSSSAQAWQELMNRLARTSAFGEPIRGAPGTTPGGDRAAIDEALQRVAAGRPFTEAADALQEQAKQMEQLAKESETALALQKEFGLETTKVAVAIAGLRAEAAFLKAVFSELNDEQKKLIENGAGVVAVLTAEQRTRFDITKRAAEEAAQRQAEANRALQNFRRETELGRQRGQRQERLEADMQRDVNRVNAQIRQLTMDPFSAARESFFERMMLAFQRADVPVTEKILKDIQGWSDAFATASERLKEVQRIMSQIQEAGQTLSRSLENAFTSWLDGAFKGWKDFFHKLSTDIAALVLRQQILQPLFGGGGIQGGGLFGSFLQSLVPGLPGRAEGGPVTAGQPFMVGERGRELFVPRQSGTIMPNSVLRGGATTINMRVDLAGANGDETIARISAQAARAAAVQAVQASNAAFPARQSQLRMLGT